MEATELFTIKMLSNEYSQKAAGLILPIQQLEFGVPITLEDQPDILDIDGYYIQKGGGFWGAIREGELIGTIAVINAGQGVGAIRKMFVKKEFRGKELGVAQQLIETLFEFSRNNGIAGLYLGSVNQMKAAHRFYERNGFEKIEPEELPGNFPRMSNDNVFYHLSISKCNFPRMSNDNVFYHLSMSK
jgi:GNAT superfamily N-acetyltransferase